MALFDDSVFIEWYANSISVVGEQHTVINGRCILNFIPDKFIGITCMKNGTTPIYYIKENQALTSSDQFSVDWSTGFITFYGNTADNATVTFNYNKRGIIKYPSTRIYVDNDDTLTLQDKIETIEGLKTTLDTRVDNHVNGTLEKHTTTHITNSSNISGTTVTDVLNNVKTRMDDHVAGTTEKHGSNAITNQSSQSGLTVSDAINSIAGVVQNITVTDSNANIGVYSLNATGTNTITTSFSGLTLFAGLKINLSIANDNVAAVTVNLNGLGAKNLYKVVNNVKTALVARDIRQGEIAAIQYDGTDFILTNGERNPEYSTTQVSTADINSLPSTAQGLMDSMVVKGRTVINLLPDAVAGCESTSGWFTSSVTGALDSSNKLEGTNCLKITLTSTSGIYYYQSILSLLSSGKYYLLTAHTKNGNLGTGIKLGINLEGDYGIKQSSYNSNTSYVRQGVLLQPSDFDSATNAYIRFDVTGSNTQYAYFDTLSLIEITSTEYALGVDALLAKYSFHLGTKSADKMAVKSVGVNLFDKTRIKRGFHLTTTNTESANVDRFYSDYIPVNKSTQYCITPVETTFLGQYSHFYDENKIWIDKVTTTTNPFTSPSNAKYVRISQLLVNLDNIILEQSTTATPYSQYQQIQSVCPIELKGVSSTIYDTWDCLSGKVTENVSDWVELSGNAYTWTFTEDKTGWKGFRTISDVFDSIAKQSSQVMVLKYNNKKITSIGLADWTDGDNAGTASGSKILYLSAFDTDTGWLEAWTTETSFTGLTWGGLIKAYMNGWKLTTANTNVASCVWTGITSGTVKNAGASDYTHVTTNIDVGFTPYKMIYQLATPVTTWLQPSTLLASANGTVFQDRVIEDYAFYNSGLALSDTNYLIETLVEVRKWNIDDGSYTIIPNTDVTVTAGVITAIVGASPGDFYSFDYNYSPYLAINGELNFSYPVNAMGQIDVNTKTIVSLDKKIDDVYSMLNTKVDSTITSVTANYTITNNDDIVLVNATSGNLTITLLASALRNVGKPITIKKIDSSANTVTIDGNASETIDGSATKVLSAQYSSSTIVPFGGNWFIV